MITRAAVALGVGRSTMYRALEGTWPNERLVRRYREFIASYAEQITTAASEITGADCNTPAPLPPAGSTLLSPTPLSLAPSPRQSATKAPRH